MRLIILFILPFPCRSWPVCPYLWVQSGIIPSHPFRMPLCNGKRQSRERRKLLIWHKPKPWARYFSLSHPAELHSWSCLHHSHFASTLKSSACRCIHKFAGLEPPWSVSSEDAGWVEPLNGEDLAGEFWSGLGTSNNLSFGCGDGCSSRDTVKRKKARKIEWFFRPMALVFYSIYTCCFFLILTSVKYRFVFV